MNVCNTVILLALNIMLIGSTSPSFYQKSVLDIDNPRPDNQITDDLYIFFFSEKGQIHK